MALTDNPLIASMYNALGMGDLIHPSVGAAVPPGASPQNEGAPTVRPGASRPNIPQWRNRPYIPRMLSNASMIQQRGMGPGVDTEPGVMNQETLENPITQQLLAHYGVDPNVTVDPNLFMHNATFNSEHPKIAGALEGALSGLAFTRSGDTIGDSISNVARGMMDAATAHSNHVNAQLMMPFQEAQQVANLENVKGMEDERAANMKHMNDMAAYYKQMANNKSTDEDLKAQNEADRAFYESQLAAARQANVDPIRTALGAYHDKAMAELAKKYGGADKIPASEYLKVITNMGFGEYTPRNAWHAGSGSKSAYQEALNRRASWLKAQISSDQKQLNNYTKVGSGYWDSETGKLLLPGTPEYKSAVTDIQTRLQANTSEMNHITSLGGTPTEEPGAPPAGSTVTDYSHYSHVK